MNDVLGAVRYRQTVDLSVPLLYDVMPTIVTTQSCMSMALSRKQQQQSAPKLPPPPGSKVLFSNSALIFGMISGLVEN